MKIYKSNKSNKKVVIFMAILIIAILFGVIYFVYIKNNTPPGAPTREEISTGEDIKDQSLESGLDGNKNQSGSDPSDSPQSIEGSNKKSVSLTINSATQEGDILQLRTAIQAITDSGKCTISITDSLNKAYTDSVGVQALPATSTCKGFDIPTSSLSKGDWTITIKFENDEIIGNATKVVNVK